MRVLHVISSGGLYGAEAVILELSAEMNAREAGASQIAVFAHGGWEPELYAAAKAAGVPVHLVPCHGQLDREVTRRLQALVSEVGADVLHAHGYKADIYTYLAFRRPGPLARVSTCHTWYDNDLAVRVYGALDRWVLRSFDQVVAVSGEVRARLQRAGVASARTHLIRNGVRLPRELALAPGQGGELRVGLVGRLAPEKGVDLFLEAASRVTAALPNTRFLVAGEGPDREVLTGKLEALSLHGRAELLGRQGDMAGFYGSLDLLVSASRQEGLPMALLEGMAMGLPVIATTVGEIPTVVVPGETGMLVPPGDPVLLAGAIEQMLRQPALLKQFGAAGRRRVAEHFGAASMTTQYVEVYRRALAMRTAASGAR